MVKWAETWGPLIQLVSTVALLVVTFWYAQTTKAMAKSAKDSALASQASAEATERAAAASETSALAARETAAVGQSQSNVDFDARVISVAGEDPDRLGVLLRCKGDTVFVHGLVVRRGWLDVAPDQGLGDTALQEADLAGERLQCRTLLPARVHRDEPLIFLRDGDLLAHPVDRLILTVEYTFSGEGVVHDRQVIYQRGA